MGKMSIVYLITFTLFALSSESDPGASDFLSTRSISSIEDIQVGPPQATY